MKIYSLISVLIAIFSVSTAFALPLPRTHRDLVQLPSNFTSDYNFEGIVELNNCSGSLIRFEKSKDTDAAMILTNGHCLEFGMPQPGKVIYNRPSSRRFGLLNPSGESAGTVNAVEVIYSTMTKTDITIYKLGQTYSDILSKYGVHALTLSAQKPSRQTAIEVISGYWHRGYTCAIEEFAYQLKEDEWTFEDSIRYSRPGCNTIGGTSGSPIVQVGTRTVVGINNTGNEDGGKCTMNNPCEIDVKGDIIFEKGYSYGQETYWINTCLNANNEIDLSKNGCMLPH